MSPKASPIEQARLLDLQAIDTRINQLDHKTKMLPEVALLALLESENTALRVEVISANGALEDARLELGRIESDVAVVETRIVRDTGRLQTSTSVKDVAGLESELAGLTRRQLDLEEIELDVMERVDGLEAAVRGLRDRSDELLARIHTTNADKQASLSLITAERTEADANRSAIERVVQGDLLALYERQKARYGTGATLLRGGTSSASGVKFNENDMDAIRVAAPDDVLLCPDSNAILVRTAESGL